MVSGQRLEGEGWCHCSSVLGSDPIRETLGWAWPGGSLRAPKLHAESECKVETPGEVWGPTNQDAVLIFLEPACHGRVHPPRVASGWKRRLGHKPWKELLVQGSAGTMQGVLPAWGGAWWGVLGWGGAGCRVCWAGCRGLMVDPAGVGSTGQEHPASV